MFFGCTQTTINKNDLNKNTKIDTNKTSNYEVKDLSIGEDKLVVEKGDLIKVDYKGTLENGTMFDSSEGREPLEFTAGAGQMIKGFDSAVIGMKIGEEKTVTLKPSEAYGERNPEAIVSIPKQQLIDAGINNPEVGMKIFASGRPVTITEVNDENVTLDFNPELAGKTLIFWIKIVDIKKQE